MILENILLLRDDPDLLKRKLQHVIYKRILKKNNIIVKNKGVYFEFDFNLDEYVEDMFLKRYENNEINILRKYLKNGHAFIDVGANIGYLSFIAAKCVGKSGHVHCFEPVMRYYHKLAKFACINNQYNIYVNNMALGDRKEIKKIYVHKKGNIGNNTLIDGIKNDDDIGCIEEVSIIRLDDYIFLKNIQNIGIIKIDTEGYELFVLRGLEKYFENNNELPPIICEITPSIYPKISIPIGELFRYMNKYNYKSYEINTMSEVNEHTIFKRNIENVLFVNLNNI